MKENIKAIFLDLGGTFRVVDEENYPFIRQAREGSRNCAERT